MTTQSSQIVLINGFGLLFVILNSFGLGLRLSVGKLLAHAFAHWKIAVWALVINFVIIPLLFVGYMLTVASSIPDGLRVKDVGIRHATEVTTAVRNIARMLLMMIFPFGADPLVTVSITILNTIGIVIVVLFVLMWRRAASPPDTHATTNQPASEGLPPPTST